MSSLFLLNFLDVARAFGINPFEASPQSVADWLIETYVRRGGGGFNYNPSIHSLFDLFRGAASSKQAILRCMTSGNPKGRAQNTEAIKIVAPFAEANISTCYRIEFSAVAVGRIGERTIYVAIKAPMVRVVHDQAFVVLPGFRMSHRPVEAQIDFACSIALANLARDDFAAADFEYLYAGPDAAGKRDFRAIYGRDRTIFDRDQVDYLLDIYVRGVQLALRAGLEPKNPDLRGYRIIDPRQPNFSW